MSLPYAQGQLDKGENRSIFGHAMAMSCFQVPFQVSIQMFPRHIIPVSLATILLLTAPLLVAASAVPASGRTLAVLLPPWQATDAQLARLADTGVTLRDGGPLAGLGPQVWLVQVPDQDSAARLSRLPALLLSGALVNCGA